MIIIALKYILEAIIRWNSKTHGTSVLGREIFGKAIVKPSLLTMVISQKYKIQT